MRKVESGEVGRGREVEEMGVDRESVRECLCVCVCVCVRVCVCV